MRSPSILNQLKNSPALEILREIGQQARHMQPHVVGGFVRDTLLGRDSFDIDVVVTATDNQNGITVARQLAQNWNGKVKIHLTFGTATVECRDGWKVDIVTARRETYAKPGTLPKVEFSNLLDDLWRRDFSVNAIAASITPDQFGQITDPTGGMDDLKKGLIRILHAESFTDDPTRIFRTVRYASRYNFQIENQTVALLRSTLDQIKSVSGSRLQNEFNHIFEESMAVQIIQRLSALGFETILCPEWQVVPQLGERWQRIRKNLGWASQYLTSYQFNPQDFFWMALDLPNQVQKMLSLSPSLQQKLVEQTKLAHRLLEGTLTRRTKPSNVYKSLKPYSLEPLVYHLPQPQIEQYLTKLRHIQPNINGKDLIDEGWCAGPKLAQILWERFAQQLDDEARADKVENQAC